MLVLSRKVGQRLVIDDQITITINRIAGNRVQVGIEAPNDVHIMRGELDKIRRQFEPAAEVGSDPLPLTIVGEFDSPTDISPRAAR